MRNPLAVGSLMLPVAAFTVSFTPYLAHFPCCTGNGKQSALAWRERLF
jgi:hypothetical protein